MTQEEALARLVARSKEYHARQTMARNISDIWHAADVLGVLAYDTERGYGAAPGERDPEFIDGWNARVKAATEAFFKASEDVIDSSTGFSELFRAVTAYKEMREISFPGEFE